MLKKRAYVIGRTDHRNTSLVGESMRSDRFRLVRLDISTRKAAVLIQGEADAVVPVDHARRFEKAALGNAFVQVQILKDETHNLDRRSNRMFVMAKALAHFQAASAAVRSGQPAPPRATPSAAAPAAH